MKVNFVYQLTGILDAGLEYLITQLTSLYFWIQQVKIIGKQHKYEIKKRASIGTKSWYWSSKPKLWFFCNEFHFKKIIFGETGTKNTYKVIKNIKYEALSETHFGKVNISCFGLRFQRKLSEDSTFNPLPKKMLLQCQIACCKIPNESLILRCQIALKKGMIIINIFIFLPPRLRKTIFGKLSS